jgi:hypothetical protein
LNLERAIKNLEKKYEFITGDNSTGIYHSHYDNDDDLIPEASAKERKAIGQELEQEQELIDHLGDYHIVPILKWKISVGLERNFGPGECFINYGEDYRNKTVEEEEYFRLTLKHHKVMGYDPKKDPQRKF